MQRSMLAGKRWFGNGVAPLIWACIAGASPLAGQSLTASQWQADLAYLARRLPVVHPNLFHRIPRPAFEAAVESLHQRMPQLASHEVVIELARLGALVGEVHTGIVLPRQPRAVLGALHAFPVRFYWYEDGLFVQAIDGAHASAAGLRVLRIGDVTADEALRRVSTIISADNPMWARRYGPGHLAVAEVLLALGVSRSRSELRLTLLDGDGRERAIDLTARPFQEMLDYVNPLWDPAPGSAVAVARQPGAAPLWLRDQRNRYWFTHLGDSRTLYIQINAMLDKQDEPFEAFVERALSVADSQPTDRLIIDVRQNNGGNHLALPLVHGIIRRPALNQRGKLFVIIGRGTVSAGQNLVTLLEIHTRALFVGEPTASRPNQYGVVGTFALPNSGLIIWHSRVFIQDADPGDYRQWTEPEIHAPLRFQDYRDNRDPALEAALAYRPMTPLEDTLDVAHRAGGLSAAMSAYGRLQPGYLSSGRRTEGALNRLGYRLLRRRAVGDAIAIFELNAREHPESDNVYDSLGDAYLRAGNREAGLAHYRTALRLNPENDYARRLIAASELER